MVEVSMTSVFCVGGTFAIIGAVAFLSVLTVDHGQAALTTW